MNTIVPKTTTNKWLLPWVISIAMFIDTLDSTIVTVAIPHIADSFNLNPIDLKLALTSYLLSLAVFIPISGWLADRYGEKRIFIFAVAIFTLSSILCAISNNLPFLVLSRMIQGFGGALMMPVGRLIVLRNFSKYEYPRAMTFVALPGLIGPALGPTLGGVILQIASWHWIFLANVPLGIGAIIVAYHIIKPSEKVATLPFNWSGFLLFSSGLACITLSLALLGDKFSLMYQAAIFFVVGILFLLFYWQVSRTQSVPLLNLTLFQQKTFRISMIVGLLVRPSVGATAFLVPLLLQTVWNKTALFAGTCFMFLALGMLCSRFLFNQKLLALFSIKKILLTSVLALLIFSMNLCWFSQPQSMIYLILLLFMIGAASVLVYTCLGLMSVLDVEKEQYSQATSMASTNQQFSIGCGIAIAAVILNLVSRVTHTPLLSNEVFFWTFIILNGLSISSLFFILQLNPEKIAIASPPL
jgi:EmrB/QacA subfamily drug resistance transporter